ncbi:sigma 54-interacting transcriptional regulator, partial [Klebsiella pneumoniae]
RGPTGTGKSFLARQLWHYAIDEGILPADAPFTVFNCAEYANNPELLTSKLFGHAKGAFTGADKAVPGLIETSNGGVLFIDEVHRL